MSAAGKGDTPGAYSPGVPVPGPPALGRGVGLLWIVLNIQQMPNIDIMTSGYITQTIIIALTLGAAWKFGTLRHPATYLAIGVNIFICFLEPIGRSPEVQAVLRTVITG